MKVTWAVIFSLGYLAAVLAHPAKQGDSEEVEFVPLEDQNGGPIIVDTGVIGGPFITPFDGLFESLAGMMTRMRQQMDYLMRRLPFRNSTSEELPFPGFPEIDLDKANTTSVTKVIDGHKVVINETSYKREGDHGGAFFKVRIIDVLPDSSELTTDINAESITNSPKEPESVENSYENEIPKNKENEDFSNVETFDQPDNPDPVSKRNLNRESVESMEDISVRSALPMYQPFQKITDGRYDWASLEPLESFEDNSVDYVYPPPDLSRDIYVNQLMADAGAPVNPDAEVFSNIEFLGPQRNGRRPYFEKIVNPR